ncbi:glycoside hydrolase family 28 protein [Sphingosinicella sp. BN140058]|uniref:glycoside hydrolase family 28 protein n=1 Tax=Sphingosinicella sp. BN140058 TaxID=1892855 RepID=UPI0010102D73|nr:glycosyl hydrolase family 28 protein [Sphingosinicella sp. BN140058]QAY78579.1 twin-arginine translocation signal domain-containing protein [Sphingosinicella sp. BN140058]
MPANRRDFLAGAGVASVAAVLAPAVANARTAAPARPAPFRAPATGLRLDPRDFGARGDGVTKDSAALQQALDRCAVLGGGEVVVDGGTYLTGALRIFSNTILRIEAGATLQGSPDLADYPIAEVRWEGRWVQGYSALISAHDARNVALAGKGRILAAMTIRRRLSEAGLRHPALLEFVGVSGLSVTDLVTEQNDMWSIHPVYCEDALFRGLTVKGNADGIDVDSCRRVAIERCDFDTVDDCISLKSGRGLEGLTIGRPTEDVTITDCVFRDQRWACIGVGSETSAGIRRVLVERCQCLRAGTFAIYLKSRPGRGAFIQDIVMRDLDISGAKDGFLRLNFLDSGKQDQFPVPGRDGIPTVRNFTFERIRIRDVPTLVEAVNVHPDKPLEGFVLRDISGTSIRGMRLANMRDVVLDGIRVNVAEGPKLATSNVRGRGVEGAAALPPTPRPAPVEADPRYRLGMTTGTPN